jgi:alpha-methylacyl-CoA racemase
VHRGNGTALDVRVIEIAGIGPGPFAAMLLADLGADVLRLDRKDGAAIARALGLDPRKDILNRSRPAVALDLKQPGAVELVLDLVRNADALTEGFRPGVMENLGLGPEACLASNPRLVYGTHDGLGPDRAVVAARRTRHQLHRDLGHAAYVCACR